MDRREVLKRRLAADAQYGLGNAVVRNTCHFEEPVVRPQETPMEEAKDGYVVRVNLEDGSLVTLPIVDEQIVENPSRPNAE